MRRIDPRYGFRSPGRDEIPASVAGLRPEIDHPIGAFDHLEIMLNHDDGVAGFDESLKQLHQHRDIVEMQACRRFIEDKEIAAGGPVLFRMDTLVREMPDKLKALRLASGKSIQRLTEPQITEPNFIQHLERISKLLRFADLREKLNRFTDGELEQVVN